MDLSTALEVASGHTHILGQRNEFKSYPSTAKALPALSGYGTDSCQQIRYTRLGVLATQRRHIAPRTTITITIIITITISQPRCPLHRTPMTNQ